MGNYKTTIYCPYMPIISRCQRRYRAKMLHVAHHHNVVVNPQSRCHKASGGTHVKEYNDINIREKERVNLHLSIQITTIFP